MLASGIAHYELLASKIAVLLGKYTVNQETGTALELAFQVSPKPKLKFAIQSAVRVVDCALSYRHGTARHGTARHGTARHGTARRLLQPSRPSPRCWRAHTRQARTCAYVSDAREHVQ